MKRKAVRMWCVWEPGWFPDIGTANEDRSLARHQARLRGWCAKYVIRVEVRPVPVKRKARKGKP